MAGKVAGDGSVAKKRAASKSRKVALEATGRQGFTSPVGNRGIPPASSMPFHATSPWTEDPRPFSPSPPVRRMPFAPPSTGGQYPGGPASMAGQYLGGPASMAGQSPWNPPRQMSAADDNPSVWDEGFVPEGGLYNFLQSQTSYNKENHFVGNVSSPTQFNRSPSFEASDSTPMPQPSSNGDTVKNRKRLFWSVEEDARLMSAWLKCSIDSVQGNDKRNEQYWGEVATTYNLTTPSERRRSPKQAKDRWHRINKLTDLFNCAYLKAQRLYTSGYNEEMWVSEAHKWYEIDNAEGRFELSNVWYIVRNEPKWQTYNNWLKSLKKRKNADGDEKETGEEEDNMASQEKPRPPGQKAAKKALHESKGDARDPAEKDPDVQLLKEAESSRTKVLEMQEKLSAERLESARLSHAAAREHKKAKTLELQVKMMETYNCLLTKDVSSMNEEEKADHSAMLKHLKTILFPELN